jgi:alkylation response protein AidB-like acyl-CoA dehydrogenase
MDFALSEEHELLRASARSFLRKEASLRPLLTPHATRSDFDHQRLWRQMVELGWPAMIIPEVFGGLGMTFVDLVMIAGEIGRVLAPTPLFGTLAGTLAILAAGTDEQKSRILSQVGTTGATLALAIADAQGNVAVDSGSVAVETSAEGITLTGRRHFVVDAASADRIVVLASEAGFGRFFVVARDAPGLQVEATDWRDVTRQVCTLTLSKTPAEPLTGCDASVWPWIRDRLYLVLASESAGGLQQVLEDTVAYASDRWAFGRPIGSYQAIKHALAEIKGQTECASVAVLYAAWELDQNYEKRSAAAAIAQSYASEAYRSGSSRCIQIFGAIGFTWEMPNHLYFKRARANAELFGAPAAQRAQLFEILEKQYAAGQLPA